MAASLRLRIVYSAIGRPQGRGKVERLFGTFNSELLPKLPGHLAGSKPATPPRLSLAELDQAISAFIAGTYHRGLLCEGVAVKFGFIAKHRAIWPMRWLCEALGVSRGGFHAWLTRSAGARARSGDAFGAHRSKPASSAATEHMAPGGSGTTCWPRVPHADCTASSD